jgi:hypothetical protein
MMDWELHQSVSVLDALRMTMNAWDKFSATFFNNCFKNSSSVCCDCVKKYHDTDHVAKLDMCKQEFNDWT